MGESHALAVTTSTPSLSWDAELYLDFTRRDDRTVLARREHRGPLAIQKALYPEGESVCHTILIHPPGGLAGGDRLQISVTAGERSHSLLTTPGASKWYKANGAAASQRIKLTVHDHAVLEWLPLEAIVYDAAQAEWRGAVHLAGDARYAGWEITCLGRQARGESFRQGWLRQRLQIYRDDKMIWGEHINLKGSDRLLSSAAGLRGLPVFATFVVAAGVTPSPLLDQCRGVQAPDGALTGVTMLPDIFAARYLGRSTESARLYFESLWAVLRPWYAGMAAQRPRIWNT